MAKMTKIVLTCDYHRDDTTEAVATMKYTIGGVHYEVDLCQGCLDESIAISREVPVVHRTKRVKTRRNGARRKAIDNAAVREWAKAQGLQVAERGRVPEVLVSEYQSAMHSS